MDEVKEGYGLLQMLETSNKIVYKGSDQWTKKDWLEFLYLLQNPYYE